MQTAIISHKVDPDTWCSDGIASVWVGLQAYPDAAVFGAIYQNPLPDLSGYGRIIFTDFYPYKDVLYSLAEQGKEVIVLDHHDNGVRELMGIERSPLGMSLNLSYFTSGILKGFLSQPECGASLTWRYFFTNKPVPAFIEYVRDRDLWLWEKEFTLAVHLAMEVKREELLTLEAILDWYDTLGEMSEDRLLTELLPIGSLPAQEHQELVANICRKHKFVTYHSTTDKTYRVPYIELEDPEHNKLSSDIGTYLYKKYPSYPFALIRTANKQQDGKVKLSFRSNRYGTDFNVCILAAERGGGGHPNAAGCAISEALFKELVVE